MKVFQLSAEPRTVLGKKAAKALRAENRIPVVLNGGASVELPYTGTLKEGEKIVELGNGKGLITTDLVVTAESVRKLHLHSRNLRNRTRHTRREAYGCYQKTSSSTP